QFATDVGAILVRDAARFVDEDSQHACAARAAHIDLDHLHSTGDAHLGGNFTDPLDVKYHETSNLPTPGRVVKAAQTKMWACAHWCASPKSVSYTTVSKDNNT